MKGDDELDEKLYVSPTDEQVVDFDPSLLEEGEGDEEEEER